MYSMAIYTFSTSGCSSPSEMVRNVMFYDARHDLVPEVDMTGTEKPGVITCARLHLSHPKLQPTDRYFRFRRTYTEMPRPIVSVLVKRHHK